MKRCFKCGKFQPLDSFYKHTQMPDGHLNKCKECAKIDSRANRESKIEYYLAYDNKRSKLPHRKQLSAMCVRNMPRHKRYAHSAVSNAVRDGRLFKQPCEVCGSVKVEAHHHDYSKPLDVQWLCFKHHRELHGNKHFSE